MRPTRSFAADGPAHAAVARVALRPAALVRVARPLAVLSLAAGAALAAEPALRTDLSLRAEARQASAAGPLTAAGALQPDLKTAAADTATWQAELRGARHLRLGSRALGVHGNVLLAREHAAHGAGEDRSRINELHATLDAGAWQFAAGKKVLSWDVGYGFRPNDLVQQEERRTLWGQTPEGRPLVQAEYFSADTAWSLVAVQPERWHDTADTQRFAREAALAGRVYRRAGAWDLHGFVRHGRHSGASVGTAVAWVATDELELHASLRAVRRHDAWRSDAAVPAASLLQHNPWQVRTVTGGSQALLGASWTGQLQQSLLVEAWHDGQAPSAAQWRDWTARNRALSSLPLQPGWPAALRAAVAGNLAWQATPLQSIHLHRDNLFVRLAWQPDAWTASLDALVTPVDRGRIVTASLQWQGDRWRLVGSWRQHGGPAAAVFSQLPVRRNLGLAASVAL